MTCIPPCSCDCRTQEIAELRAELTSVREQLGNARTVVEDLLGLELGSGERAMAWLQTIG